MYNHQPSACTIRFVDLPLSNLHIMEAGEGERLSSHRQPFQNWKIGVI